MITYLEFLSQGGWSDILLQNSITFLIFDPHCNPMGSFSNPYIWKCSMTPEWHQLAPMSGHVEESRHSKKLELYATLIFQVHSFVNSIIKWMQHVRLMHSHDSEATFCAKCNLIHVLLYYICFLFCLLDLFYV